MGDSTLTLSFAIRPRVVARYLGQLLLILAALTVVPLVVALALGEAGVALRHAGSIVVLVGLGWAGARLRGSERVQANEAMVITALAYVAASASGAVAMAGHGLSPVDAVFESVSGVTTTGLSMASAQTRSALFLFSRAWAQWYGGLGIVVFSMALVIRPGVITRRLAASAGTSDDRIGGARVLARRIVGVYAVLTAAGIGLLLATGAGLRNAVLLTMTGVSTGGFASTPESLAALAGWPARLAAVGLGLVGATSFVFFIRLRREGLGAVRHSPQVGLLALAALVVTAAMAACLVGLEGMGWREAALQAPALAISAQTTTGFSTLDVGGLAPASKLVLSIAMAIGGEVGSTAGGIKILRVLILIQLLRVTLARASMPHRAVSRTRLGGETLEDEELREALLVILLFLGVMLLSWVPFVSMGHDPLDSLFEVVSATGTVGLSTGVCGPSLAWPLKLVLCADMLLGRLEILAWLVLVHPRTWLGHREGAS